MERVSKVTDKPMLPLELPAARMIIAQQEAALRAFESTVEGYNMLPRKDGIGVPPHVVGNHEQAKALARVSRDLQALYGKDFGGHPHKVIDY